MAIDPETSLMVPGSSGLADITQGIENVTLVRKPTEVFLYQWYTILIVHSDIIKSYFSVSNQECCARVAYLI